MREWALGVHTGETGDKTVQLNSQAIGQMMLLRRMEAFLQYDYEDFVEEMSDGDGTE